MMSDRLKELSRRKPWSAEGIDDQGGEDQDDQEILRKVVEMSLQTKKQEDERRIMAGVEPSQIGAEISGEEASQISNWLSLSYGNRMVSGLDMSRDPSNAHMIPGQNVLQAMPREEKQILVRALGEKTANAGGAGVGVDDDDLTRALQLSMDPNEQLNPEWKKVFQATQQSLGAIPKVPSGNSQEELVTVDVEDDDDEEEDENYLRVLENSKKETRNPLLHMLDQEEDDAMLALAIAQSEKEQRKMMFLEQLSIEDIIGRKRVRGEKRPIIIDAGNVAYAHSNHTQFSTRGIALVYNYFHKRGHKKIYAFMIKPRRNKLTDVSADLLEQMIRDEMVTIIPPKILPTGEKMAHYDDYYLLNLAKETGGVIVSNDKFRDILQAHPQFKREITENVLSFQFAEDTFLPTFDPQGRHGPKLDQFLLF